MDEDELFDLEVTPAIIDSINSFFKIKFNPFFDTFKIDFETKSYIDNIIGTSKLTSIEQKKTIVDLFIKFFSFDFENSIYNVIQEFEASLRFLFESSGLYIYKKSISHDLIGLSNIFSQNNNYKELLLKYIDEDYFFSLKWLLVSKYGLNSRNRISHRINTNEFYNSLYAIYTVFLIFVLYLKIQ